MHDDSLKDDLAPLFRSPVRWRWKSVKFPTLRSLLPRDQGFHWNSTPNGESQYLIGEAMGEGIKTLLRE
jgi:hypothetical protein